MRSKVIARRKSCHTAAASRKKYLAKLRATRGIVTNGQRWVFISIAPKLGTKYQFVGRVLLDIELGKLESNDRRALEKVLSRCFPSGIRQLFEMLEKLAALSTQGIQDLTRNQPPSQWASVLAAAIRDTRDVSKGNLSVLSALTRDTVLFSDSILKAYWPVKNIRAK